MDITAATGAFENLTRYAVTDTQIYQMAQEHADANGAPVAVWTRDGWSVICEEPEPEPEPEAEGWEMVAIIDPTDDEPREKGDDDGREYGDPRDARSTR